MLVSMTVRNVALIEQLQIRFHKGMNVLSGETGAGKSIIVDSINLILGERADRGLIRSGCDKASVEAWIDITGQSEVHELLKEQELEPEDELLSIQREITAEGRNICRVCGVVVPLAFLRSLTAHLMDIHGQHAHQSLLDSKNHMAFLDAFGDEAFEAQKERVRDTYSVWRQSGTHYAALRKENAQREERMAYLGTRIKDLDSLALEAGEAERLSEEKARLAGSEKISTGLRTAYGEVQGTGRDKSALSMLRDAGDALRNIEQYDARIRNLADRLNAVYFEAEEIGIELRDLVENEAYDPERFEEVQDRLDRIRRLERRYGMTADELVAHHGQIREELERLSGMEDRLKRAEADYKQKLQAYRAEAQQLTALRKALAERFEAAMERELKDLGMQNTRFACVFEEPEPGQKKVPTALGDDHVCFYIAPNPGEPLKPLDKTASGGELSRLMLAIKTTGAAQDGIPCMVFDEVDTGISGHVAGVVGEKMALIARKHQVLCVTHLAQIAAMADEQFLVRKSTLGDRTHTEVTPLDTEGRVNEIARLIGVTDSDRESGMAHARAVLANAEARKKSL